MIEIIPLAVKPRILSLKDGATGVSQTIESPRELTLSPLNLVIP